jgi:hypothetical protein
VRAVAVGSMPAFSTMSLRRQSDAPREGGHSGTVNSSLNITCGALYREFVLIVLESLGKFGFVLPIHNQRSLRFYGPITQPTAS